jgi:hypothetical protein
VTITFPRGDKAVAAAEGNLVESGTKYTDDDAICLKNTNGTWGIQEIRFAGSSELIEFNP